MSGLKIPRISKPLLIQEAKRTVAGRVSEEAEDVRKSTLAIAFIADDSHKLRVQWHEAVEPLLGERRRA